MKPCHCLILRFFEVWAETVGFGERALSLEYGEKAFHLSFRQGEVSLCRKVELRSDLAWQQGVEAEVVDKAREFGTRDREQIRKKLNSLTKGT